MYVHSPHMRSRLQTHLIGSYSCVAVQGDDRPSSKPSTSLTSNTKSGPDNARVASQRSTRSTTCTLATTAVKPPNLQPSLLEPLERKAESVPSKVTPTLTRTKGEAKRLSKRLCSDTITSLGAIKYPSVRCRWLPGATVPSRSCQNSLYGLHTS